MFGNLFGEDNEGFGSEADASFSFRRNPTSSPPRPRLKCNLAGITNQGATCYLNSLLQTLLLTPEFRESLFQIPRQELGNLEDKEKTGSKVRVIPLELQRLFVRLLFSNRQSVSTRELTESFGWSNNEELQQHDVQELNRILFSAINDSLAGTSGGNLISDLYHGSIVNQIKCLECETCSEREEDFLDLTLTISGNNSLESALCKYYEETELLNDKNQYRCEICNKLVNAKKYARLRKLPPILSVSLLRFSYDFHKMERFKELGKFAFPLELDMSPYTDKPSASDKYELFSIVIHQGSAYGGHYHAYIRDVDSLGTWYNPDDAEIQLEPSKDSKRLDIQEVDSPLQLLEALLKEHEDKSLALDKLGSEMVTRTSISWNSRFKKQYGPMSKFIKKHDDVFDFNQSTNIIHLKETYSIADHTSTSKQSVISGQSDSSIEKKQVKKGHRRPKSPPHPESDRCWFDFNDSRVSPIRTNDIENQFQGKESAYMLFYRKKYLSRPPDAKHNPGYCISEIQLMEVVKENEKIEQEIVEYNVLLNTLTLQIHFGCQYEFTNGALQTSSNLSWLELLIDKRKTVTELLVAVQELGGELVSGDYVLSRIRELPAGYHVYEILSDDTDETIDDVYISNGDKILVWDGQQIGSCNNINTGNDCEPIFLTVIYGENSHRYSAGFSQNMTLRQFIAQVCSVVDIPNQEIAVKKLVSDNKSVILDVAANLTLQELAFNDGDHLQIHKKNSDVEPSMSTVEVNGQTESSDEVFCVPVPIVSAVVNSRIRLSFTLGDPKSGRCDQEIIVDNTVTVQECLSIMLIQSELPSRNYMESWHLRKTNWCGEAADILDEPHLTLRQAIVQDGDHLLIEEGRLPPKGFVVLSIWLYSNLQTPKSLSNENNGLMSWITNGMQALFTQTKQNEDKEGSQSTSRKYINMGDVEIWRESMLEDLKLQIFTLPQVAELQVPTLDFLRVRKLNGSRPSTILRDHSHSLKRNKIRTSESLAIEILPTEEKLSNSEVIIEVKLRNPDSKSYYPSIEVLWDISKGNGVAHLQQTIADALALPYRQVLIAKHFPIKFDWMVIKEKPSSANKKGKKKGHAQKVNLRQSPYFIGDGDTIGVKNIEIDKESGFLTEEDTEGRKNLARIAEEKRQKRQNKEEGCKLPTTPRNRRPEVALTIKVDKFT